MHHDNNYGLNSAMMAKMHQNYISEGALWRGCLIMKVIIIFWVNS
jgi:hypothetical protein